MNYSLGNMLSRGGALNPDGLSLDLAFATDKTLTARRGPTPTFTRASTATFVGSDGLIQSAAVNEPRFDHDPVTLACKGLLIEESRTNLALQSETFPLPTWSKTNVTTSPNTIASPSGTVSADTLNEDTATSFHYIFQQFAKAASSLTYSYSIYYKNASGTRTVVLALTNGTTSGKAAIFTTSGTVTATNVNIGGGAGFTFVSADVESVGNGWYRASIVVTSDTSTRLDAVTYLNDSTTVINSYTGNMSSVYLWGAQLEAGSFPTSYIPTTTAALTRSADVCSISGANFTSFWNQSEGTLFASGITQGYLAMASSGANANQIAIFRNPSPLYMRFDVAVGGSYGAQIIGPTITGASFNKIAGSYALNDVRAAFNGALGTQDTTVTIPSNLTTLNIGSQSLGAAPHNGHVARIQYFRKLLPNAKLQSLTT